MKRKSIALFFIFFLLSLSAFAEGTLTVVPSSSEVGTDENLRLDFRITTEGATEEEIGEPEFDAKDFEPVNSFNSRSTGIQTTFGSGGFAVKRTESISVILLPKRTGQLEIKNLRIKVGDSYLKAAPLKITVVNGGNRGSRSTPSYSMGSPSVGLPKGKALPNSGRAEDVVIRAEPSKLKVLKGEQILLTFALYTRVDIQNIQVERYPTVPGFVKEEIQMPLQSQGLKWSREILDGKEYQRAVIAQYAIYPTKEGVMEIDPFTAKLAVRRRMAGMPGFDEDDLGLFTGLSGFLQNFQPVVISRSSDRIKVEVASLPEQDRPTTFNGLVGDFDLNVAVDKYSVKVGEPLNVKVVVEGEGNAAGLEKLNVEWPKEFDLYEDKVSSRFLRAGYSEKLFEYLLIPKEKGSLMVPAFSLSFYNPKTRSYSTKKTEPVKIEVLEGTLGAVYQPVLKSAQAPTSPKPRTLSPWFGEEAVSPVAMTSNTKPYFSWWLGASLVSALLLCSGVFLNMRNRTGKKRKEQGISELLKKLETLPVGSYQALEGIVYDGIALLYRSFGKVFGKSLTRSDLKEQLQRMGVEDSIVDAIIRVLTASEDARYAAQMNDPNLFQNLVAETRKLLISIDAQA